MGQKHFTSFASIPHSLVFLKGIKHNYLKWNIICIIAISSIQAQNSAPSSHFSFRFDNNTRGEILINEVRIPSSGVAMYTYYESLGWSGNAGGYGGIQEHPYNNGKPYIFSIWDNPAQSDSIKEVDVGFGTETESFGGEGTGLKSMNFVLGWEPDVWYALVARCWPVGTHTYYAYFVRDGTSDIWRHLVTMDVSAENALMSPSSSFIEDWSSTGANARETNIRKAWKYAGGNWYPMESGYYSVNKNDIEPGGRSYNYRTNWDGGIKEDATGKYYYMISGGASTAPTCDNGTTFSIPRPGEIAPDYPSFNVATLHAKVSGTDLIVSWYRDSTTLPLLTYTFEVFNDSNCSGTALASVSKTEPKRGADTLDISSLTPDSKKYFLRMSVTDILVNEVIPKIIPFGYGVGITQNSASYSYNRLNIRLDNHGTLQFSVLKNSNYTLSLRTLNGSEIIRNKMRLSAGIQSIKLLERCSAGAYIVSISEESGITGRNIVFYNGK